MTDPRIAVLGAGSWGTALAKLLAEKGYPTRLWARRAELAELIERTHQNEAYLPGFELPANLHATSDLGEALEGASLVLSVIPTHGLRATLEEAAPLIPPGAIVTSATKGIENESLDWISTIFEAHLDPSRHAALTYLSGPSFAREVAAGLPTAVSIAASDPSSAARAQKLFTTDRFRVYTTRDVIGVELGGALKNVIAIAAGIADGL
ncbi:MAG: NAD(P)H-dependent glycerol-3-phosphate dehydrogenase, partial [Myxococcales bacterium]|nr:NAD(P)H-dependent glycerol-3-phosphate dehydrogenase [Myxococcales bacterium]